MGQTCAVARLAVLQANAWESIASTLTTPAVSSDTRRIRGIGTPSVRHRDTAVLDLPS